VLPRPFLPASIRNDVPWLGVLQVCTALPLPQLPPNFLRPHADAYTPDLINACDCMLGKHSAPAAWRCCHRPFSHYH
jgi:hypothetical protein